MTDQGSHAFRMMKFLDFSRTFQDLILFFKDPPGLKQQLTRINILSQVTDFHCCYINRANNDSMALTKKY